MVMETEETTVEREPSSGKPEKPHWEGAGSNNDDDSDSDIELPASRDEDA